MNSTVDVTVKLRWNTIYIFKRCCIIIAVLAIVYLLLGYIAYQWFKNNFDCYSHLTELLQSVSGKGNSFMNYGYWDEEGISLSEANRKLCDFMYRTGELEKAKKILDVGCGYADQDIHWAKSTSANIQCIDVDSLIVAEARKKIEERNLSDRVKVTVGDACKLLYKDNSFDTVISLESAFHYEQRCSFFKESYRVLEKHGTFVVADILFNNKPIDISNKVNRELFATAFHIPEANRIGKKEYIRQLEDIGFTCENIRHYRQHV